MTNVFSEGWLTFKSIFTGMGVTIRHLFGPSVTERYPEEKIKLPKGARAKLYVNIDDCIGCSLCERACPVNCITIDKVKATSDVDLGKTSTGNPKRFWITDFEIDMAKCMYCDLCVYPCPTECIYMVPEYEYSEYDRKNLVYQFSELGPEKVAEVKEKAEKEAEEQRREKAKAKKKKAQKSKAQAKKGATKSNKKES
ncbi:MAG: NADH-quinone oxidoreductase subunit I [Balneolaceae bacterium]|nr:NADH-quinone oxidoreductase subunit I [Balneolaceae bacterium]